ncbi:hypothetical protein WN51_07684 [Melipona quadrifasciata]|uniref:Uncharacterized protein n=1 Tax=Melipona quadrifasciata TaxID=166423 RepID=A0A0N0U6M8_9HYME|nr:hypothetical protein WN51_07684 [Melipona quadrifasciata]
MQVARVRETERRKEVARLGGWGKRKEVEREDAAIAQQIAQQVLAKEKLQNQMSRGHKIKWIRGAAENITPPPHRQRGASGGPHCLREAKLVAGFYETRRAQGIGPIVIQRLFKRPRRGDRGDGNFNAPPDEFTLQIEDQAYDRKGRFVRDSSWQRTAGRNSLQWQKTGVKKETAEQGNTVFSSAGILDGNVTHAKSVREIIVDHFDVRTIDRLTDDNDNNGGSRSVVFGSANLGTKAYTGVGNASEEKVILHENNKSKIISKLE